MTAFDRNDAAMSRKAQRKQCQPSSGSELLILQHGMLSPELYSVKGSALLNVA